MPTSVSCAIVDEIWHQHILDTAAYREHCEPGMVIGALGVLDDVTVQPGIDGDGAP